MDFGCYDYEKSQKEFPGSSVFKPMKIGNFPNTRGITLEALCKDKNYIAQQKIDGLWCAFNKGSNGENYLFMRTESVKNKLPVEKGDRVPHIIELLSDMPNDSILIGELWTGNIEDTAKDVTSIVGSLPARAIKLQEERGKLHLLVHDILMYDGRSYVDCGYEERYNALADIIHDYKLYFHEDPERYITIPWCYDGDDAMEFASEIISQGGEGIILKEKNWKYEFGKRPAYSSIKIKKHDTVDVVIMDTVPATEQYTGNDPANWTFCCVEGKLVKGPSLKEWLDRGIKDVYPVTKPFFYGYPSALRVGAYDSNGELKEIGTVSSGLTDDLKEKISVNEDYYIGKVVECSVMEKQAGGTLRHPVFVRLRLDKNADDCKWHDIFG